jgi:GT2 family glycosyltransferase
MSFEGMTNRTSASTGVRRSHPSVSLIVINYNGISKLGNLLIKCIDSLLKTDYPIFEVIFVDNCSTDESIAVVRNKFDDEKLRILPLKQNYGYTGATNEAAKIARGDIIGVLNDDIIVTPKWLSRLVDELLRDPKVMVATPQLYMMEKPDLVMSRGGTMNLFLVGWDRCLMFPSSTPAIDKECLHPAGAAFIFWKDLLPKIGGEVFDNTYFAYFEDVDFGWRTWLAGYKVIYVHDSIVFHRGGGTWGLSSASKFYYMRKNAILTGVKNLDVKTVLALLPIWLISSFLAGLIFYRATHYSRYVVSGAVAALSALKNIPKVWRKRMETQNFPKLSALLSNELLTYRPNLIQLAFAKIVSSYAKIFKLKIPTVDRLAEYPTFQLLTFDFDSSQIEYEPMVLEEMTRTNAQR